MSTTAFDDQFVTAPEPVRQPYDTASILRRNVADLELTLKRQTELKEKAEAELAKLWEQKPLTWGTSGELMDILKNPIYSSPAPVPAPAVSAANPVQWLEDEGDMILVPRGLLGAACYSIDKQRPAPKVLEAMRHYTMNAPQAPAAPLVDGSDEYYEYLGALVESHPAGVIRHNSASVHAPAVPELDPMTRLIVSDPKQIKPKKQEPAVPTNTIPEGDDFNGTTPHMIRCIESLVSMNDRGALAPHGLCGHSRTLLLASANRLRQQQAHVVPAVPEEWRDVMQDAHDTFQRYADQHRAKDTRDSHEKANVNQKLANRLYALLQSAEVRHD